MFDIAIVTVSTNKLDEACLTSVKQLIEATPLRVCFVLVDNGSTVFDAHTRVKTHLPEATVILRNKNHGMGRSSNRGAAEVEANYYFFLNPDTCVKDVSLLTRLHAFMQSHPQVGIAAPKVLYMDGRLQETCRRFPSWYSPIAQRTSFLPKKLVESHRKEFLMEDFSHGRRRMVDWVQGSAFMIDGALFRKLGGFDDRFWMYYEDVDLCRRCWNEGRPVYYLPDVELFHAYGKESAKVDGVVTGIVKNHKARMHIVSWIKYTLKWMGEKV